jgi:LmbE family N-acetylglucosaminyl deacetylase
MLMTYPRRLLALFLAATLLPNLRAQTPIDTTIAATSDYQPLRIDRGTPALQQSLRKLNTRASLMLIVAHPDDEDGGMLTYESRGQGARVALLTLNRGEGGQNIMSNDLWDQLALVRTQELLAADRRYGVDQYFTRVADFGFSKTLDEALTVWGHDRVLYDVVRAVRLNRPLVLAAVFVGGITDGHGQHQVSGEMAQEVFKAAGDPKVFPDQIKAGLLPWTPLKVYARVPSFSISPKGMYDYATGKWAPVRFHDYVADKDINAVPSTTLDIPEGEYDPVLGTSYIALAREGLGQQKSQNGGTGIPLAGEFKVPYHRYGSRVPAKEKEQSFFDGINTSLAGIATLATGQHPFLTTGLAQIASTVAQATKTPTVAILATGLKQTQSLRQKVQSSNLAEEEKYNITHELLIKEAQFNSAIIEALGVTLTAVVAPANPDRGRSGFAVEPQDTFTTAVPGQSFSVTAYVTNPSQIPIQIQNVTLNPTSSGDWKITPAKPVEGSVEGNQRQAADFKVTIPDDAPVTKACFHRKDVEQSYYDLDSVSCLDHPLPPYPLEAWLTFDVDGVTVRTGQSVQTVQHEVGRGGVYQPLLIAPALSVAATSTAGIIPLEQQKPAAVNVRVRSNIKLTAPAEVHLDLPQGWQSKPQSTSFKADEQTLTFQVTPRDLQAATYPIGAMADYQGRQYTQGYQTVGYPGLRPYNYYPAAPYKLAGVDVKVAPGLKVGYVMGTGDDVPQSLESMGVAVHLLQPADITAGDLSNWDVIVLGIRAYAARPELAAANHRLLDYVSRGGVLIVQYNSREYDHNYGPYPITLTGDPEKVVDEGNQVQLLEPANPLLSWPNKITAADFKGWVEERGHSFMHSWDPHYRALTETHDPGQDEQKGGLLYASYGKGAYVYVAYALYRQLPEGIPGAYRLFANLLSLPKAPDK